MVKRSFAGRGPTLDELLAARRKKEAAAKAVQAANLTTLQTAVNLNTANAAAQEAANAAQQQAIQQQVAQQAAAQQQIAQQAAAQQQAIQQTVQQQAVQQAAQQQAQKAAASNAIVSSVQKTATTAAAANTAQATKAVQAQKVASLPFQMGRFNRSASDIPKAGDQVVVNGRTYTYATKDRSVQGTTLSQDKAAEAAKAAASKPALQTQTTGVNRATVGPGGQNPFTGTPTLSTSTPNNKTVGPGGQNPLTGTPALSTSTPNNKTVGPGGQNPLVGTPALSTSTPNNKTVGPGGQNPLSKPIPQTTGVNRATVGPGGQNPFTGTPTSTPSSTAPKTTSTTGATSSGAGSNTTVGASALGFGRFSRDASSAVNTTDEYIIKDGKKYKNNNYIAPTPSSSASSSAGTYYDVDASLASVYSQAQAAGISIAKPTSYGQSITDQAQAQKIIDDYVAKANAAGVTTLSGVATTYYDISKNLTNVNDTLKEYNITLTTPKNTQYTSEAAAQAALDAYIDEANKALDTWTKSQPVKVYDDLGREQNVTYDQYKQMDSWQSKAKSSGTYTVLPEEVANSNAKWWINSQGLYEWEPVTASDKAALAEQNKQRAQFRQAPKTTLTAGASASEAYSKEWYSTGGNRTQASGGSGSAKLAALRSSSSINASSSAKSNTAQTAKATVISSPTAASKSIPSSSSSKSSPVAPTIQEQMAKNSTIIQNTEKLTINSQISDAQKTAELTGNTSKADFITGNSALAVYNRTQQQQQTNNTTGGKTISVDNKKQAPGTGTQTKSTAELLVINSKTETSSHATVIPKSTTVEPGPTSYIQGDEHKLITYGANADNVTALNTQWKQIESAGYDKNVLTAAEKQSTLNPNYKAALETAKAEAAKQEQLRQKILANPLLDAKGNAINQITESNGLAKISLVDTARIVTPVYASAESKANAMTATKQDYDTLLGMGLKSSKDASTGKSILAARELDPTTQYYSQDARQTAVNTAQAQREIEKSRFTSILGAGLRQQDSLASLLSKPATEESNAGVKEFKTIAQLRKEAEDAKYAEYQKQGGILAASTKLDKQFREAGSYENVKKKWGEADAYLSEKIGSIAPDIMASDYTAKRAAFFGKYGLEDTRAAIQEKLYSNPWTGAVIDLGAGMYAYGREKPLSSAAIVGSSIVGGELMGAAFGAGKIGVAATGAKGTRWLTGVVGRSMESGVGRQVAKVIGEDAARAAGAVISKAPVTLSKGITAGANTYFEAEIAKGGINALYGEDTVKNIKSAGQLGVVGGYASGGITGAITGGIAGVETATAIETAKPKNYGEFTKYGAELALTLPFFGAGERKFTNFFSRASIDKGPKVAGWAPKDTSVFGKKSDVLDHTLGEKTGATEVLTRVNGKPVKDATVNIGGETYSASDVRGKSTTVKKLDGESLGADRLTYKAIPGSKIENNPSLSDDAYIKNVRLQIGLLAQEGKSDWSPVRATMGVMKAGAVRIGRATGAIPDRIVGISYQPYHPLATRGSVIDYLGNGRPISGVRGTEVHSIYKEVEGHPVGIFEKNPQTGEYKIIPESGAREIPTIHRVEGMMGTGKGVTIPGTNKRIYLPIEFGKKVIAPGHTAAKLLGTNERYLTREYRDTGRKKQGKNKYGFGGDAQYIVPDANPYYSEYGEYFISKGNTTRSKQEVHVLSDLKGPSEVKGARDLQSVKKEEYNKQGRFTPETYKEAGEATIELSRATNEPVTLESKKTASGWSKPEAEAFVVYGSPESTAITSQRRIGWNKYGNVIREVRFGSQEPVKGNLLTAMFENAKYNWRNTLTGQGEYIKGMAYRANRRAAEIEAQKQPADGKRITARPDEFKKGFSTNPVQHVNAVEKNMEAIWNASPELQAKYSLKEFQVAGKLHDQMRIREKETEPLPHDRAMGKAIERGLIEDKDLNRLSRKEQREVADAIGDHTNALQSTLENMVLHPSSIKYKISRRSGIGKALDNADRLARAQEKAKGGNVADRIEHGKIWDLPVDSNSEIGVLIKGAQPKPGAIQTGAKRIKVGVRSSVEEALFGMERGTQRMLADETATLGARERRSPLEVKRTEELKKAEEARKAKEEKKVREVKEEYEPRDLTRRTSYGYTPTRADKTSGYGLTSGQKSSNYGLTAGRKASNYGLTNYEKPYDYGIIPKSGKYETSKNEKYDKSSEYKTTGYTIPSGSKFEKYFPDNEIRPSRPDQKYNPYIPGSKPYPDKPYIPGSKPYVPGTKPYVPGTKPYIPGSKPYEGGEGGYTNNGGRDEWYGRHDGGYRQPPHISDEKKEKRNNKNKNKVGTLRAKESKLIATTKVASYDQMFGRKKGKTVL